MKKLVVILAILIALPSWSSVQLFGLQISAKTTEEELRNKFGQIQVYEKESYWLDKHEYIYNVYQLSTSNINMSGLKNLFVVLNEKNQILKITADFQNNQYDKIKNILKEKYNVVREQNVPSSVKTIILKQDDTIILAGAQHASNDMYLYYFQNDFFDKMYKYNKIQEQKQAEAEKKLF